MSIPVSLCCNIVDPKTAPEEWQTAFYHVDIAEESTAVAVELAQEIYLKPEALELGIEVPELFVSTVHPGHLNNRCDGIDFAGVLEIDEAQQERLYPIQQAHTVCGWVLETGQCYSGTWVSHGPLMACAAVWDYFISTYKRTLEISCVHEGTPTRALWSPTYADPSCTTDVAMARRLKEILEPESPESPKTSWQDKVRGFLKR